MVVPFLGQELQLLWGLWSGKLFHPKVSLWSIFLSGNRSRGVGCSEHVICLLGTGRMGSDPCEFFFGFLVGLGGWERRGGFGDFEGER